MLLVYKNFLCISGRSNVVNTKIKKKNCVDAVSVVKVYHAQKVMMPNKHKRANIHRKCTPELSHGGGSMEAKSYTAWIFHTQFPLFTEDKSVFFLLDA